MYMHTRLQFKYLSESDPDKFFEHQATMELLAIALQDQVDEFKAQIISHLEQVDEFKPQIIAHLEQIDELKTDIKTLTNQNNKDSHNSSKLPLARASWAVLWPTRHAGRGSM